MKRFALIVILLLSGLTIKAQSLYFPPTSGNTWDTVSPASMNWCPDSIQALYNYLDTENSKSFILLKDGKIILEQYFNNHGPDSLWVWFSAGKSLISVLVGIAQSEGSLDINDKTSDYLSSGWTSMPSTQEDSILVRHQISMSTGLDPTDFYCTDDTCLKYLAPAGSQWFYHNAPYSLVRAVLENATGQNLNIFTWNRIGSKTGMGGLWIASGYNNFYWSKARDMARFGLMIQAKGKWDTAIVLADTAYYNQMINSSQSMNPAYGYLWWLNGKSSFIPPGTAQSFPGPINPDAPSDLFMAAGAQGQFISISPSHGLVMIRQGLGSANTLVSIDFHNEVWRRILELDCTNGIEYNDIERQFSIYPNPVTDLLNIDGPISRDTQVQVCDIQGRVILKTVNSARIDLSSLKKGSYLVRIINQERVSTQIVIKQ